MPPYPGLVETPTRSIAAVRPFLKWAGGKRQLLPVLRQFYPRRFDRYFEPFLGSGAVFFDLYNSGLTRDRECVLVDTNPDLIGCYAAIRDDVETVIRELQVLADKHARRGAAFFYDVRDREFNPARKNLATVGDLARHYPPRLAAMFIYLNRTGFNGLYRLNAAGRFNVPAGRYINPQICAADNLRAVAAALSDNVTLCCGAFEDVRGLARRRDFLYFDPPYAPVSKTARFTSYTANQFGSEDQKRLHALAVELARKGCHIVISNSTAPEIEELYESATTDSAGLTAYRVSAKRAINSDPAGRGNVTEFVLANTERLLLG